MKLIHSLLSLAFVTLLAASSLIAQETPAKPTKPATKDQLIKKLTDTLTGAKLTGKFTILGKEDANPRVEEYTILSATKTDEGDVWLLKARIKYGDKDVTLPVPLEIQWAGETPIITMTDMGIPGLGEKFSTRVVIYDGMYAGTWAHGPVKGHMFGTITK